jgi:PKD repeat protein
MKTRIPILILCLFLIVFLIVPVSRAWSGSKTLWFREDNHTVNGLTANKLNQTSSENAETGYIACANLVYPIVAYWGIRVWIRSSSGTETEVTSGTPVAQVSRLNDGEGIQSGTWSCPAKSMSLTDAIVVRVYGEIPMNGIGWTLFQEVGIENDYSIFITDQLTSTGLIASIWTIHYYTAYYSYDGIYFVYDNDDVPSQIINIQWITLLYIVARFTYSPVNPFVNEPVQFNGSASMCVEQITSGTWDFGDGSATSSNFPLATHAYTKNGFYPVKLSIASSSGSYTDSFTMTIYVSLLLLPNARVESPVTLNRNQLYTFNGSQSRGTNSAIINYAWNWGDGTRSAFPRINLTAYKIQYGLAPECVGFGDGYYYEIDEGAPVYLAKLDPLTFSTIANWDYPLNNEQEEHRGYIIVKNGFIYISDSNINPAVIYKINESRMQTYTTLTMPNGVQNCYATCEYNNFLYLSYMGGTVIKIDLSTFSYVSSISTVDAYIWRLLRVGNYLYGVADTHPGQVVKIDLNSFTFVSALSLTGAEGADGLANDDAFLYVSGMDSNLVSKVSLSTFTEVGTITIPNLGNTINSLDLAATGTYLWDLIDYGGFPYVAEINITGHVFYPTGVMSAQSMPGGGLPVGEISIPSGNTFSGANIYNIYAAVWGSLPGENTGELKWTILDYGAGVTVQHTYLTAGTYAINLTVTDDYGFSNYFIQHVTVSSSISGGVNKSWEIGQAVAAALVFLMVMFLLVIFLLSRRG